MTRSFRAIKSLLITTLSFFTLCGTLQASPLVSPEVETLVRNGGFILKRPGRQPLQYNSRTLLIPASILKIATAAASLAILGPEFRFQTEFYQDTKGNLIIKGLGDPFLISEEIARISRELKKNLKGPPSRILIDQSAFDLSRRAHGTENSLNPYDSGNAALSVNFNTINIRVAENGTTTSAEPQTPTLPLMKAFGRNIEPGEHRINISGLEDSAVQYAGQLFAAFLESADSETSAPESERISLFEGKLPPEPIYTNHSSKNLTAVLEAMLLYSNNFMANQLFLTCGARMFGSPATWAKGRRALEWFLCQKIGLSDQSFRIKEGSGISRGNKITAEAMIKIIEGIRPYAHLLPSCEGHLLKTGTMTGVSNYAGYYRTDKGLQPLVIILNQESNNRQKVLRLLLNRDNTLD